MLIDTPGQIEVFTWSASGTIITEALVGAGRPLLATVSEPHQTCVSSSGVFVSLRGRLCDGHVPQRQPRHLHVQHAVRLQVRPIGS